MPSLINSRIKAFLQGEDTELKELGIRLLQEIADPEEVELLVNAYIRFPYLFEVQKTMDENNKEVVTYTVLKSDDVWYGTGGYVGVTGTSGSSGVGGTPGTSSYNNVAIGFNALTTVTTGTINNSYGTYGTYLTSQGGTGSPVWTSGP